MNATRQNTGTGHATSYEANRDVAAQLRSEFIAAGVADIWRQARAALGRIAVNGEAHWFPRKAA